jgi:histidinol-phosphate phosphatase family protein
MNPNDFAIEYLRSVESLLHCLSGEAVGAVLRSLERAHRAGRHVFIIGNGGSAATASHMANDFVWALQRAGLAPMKALSLCDNVALMTAIANDAGYDQIFVAQLEPLAQRGDVLIAITGSGNSPNVLRALEAAKRIGMETIGLLGMDGGKARGLVDIALIVPSDDYGPIEDIHMVLDHLATAYLKKALRRPAVFLDRDGVIVKDVENLVHERDFELLPGVPAAIARLSSAGYAVVVVTNQPVVARGLVAEADVQRASAALEEMLRSHGAVIERTYFCPHHPNATVESYRRECDCRKPRAGLVLRAARDLGLELSRSFLVGDRPSDIAAGKRAGCRTVLVETGKHTAPPIESPDAPTDVTADVVLRDLPAAAEWILAQ